MEHVFVSTNTEETKRLGAALSAHLQPGDTITLNGDLGAGKTQFVQGVAEALGVAGEVTSPTFNILLSYENGHVPLNHFDLYRLEDASELDDIGFWEVLEAGGASFIEWAEKFPDEMPDDSLEVCITASSDGTRYVEARARGPRSEELLGAWQRELAR